MHGPFRPMIPKSFLLEDIVWFLNWYEELLKPPRFRARNNGGRLSTPRHMITVDADDLARIGDRGARVGSAAPHVGLRAVLCTAVSYNTRFRLSYAT